MAEWRWFREINREVGFENGRLIAQFPKSWKKAVIKKAWDLVQSGVNKDIKVASLVERMRSPDFDAKLLLSSRNYDSSEGTWLDRALAQKEPFDAILANESHPSTDYIRIGEDYFEDERYSSITQGRFPRTTTGLLGPCLRILSNATEVKVIDPYFRPDDPRKMRPLLGLLAMIAESDSGIKQVELHTARSDNFSQSTVNNWRRELLGAIPYDLRVKIHFWAARPGGENLHPRFVLTDKAGLKFDYGFDEGDSSGESTIVDVLIDSLRRQIWGEYCLESGTFAINQNDHVIDVVRSS